MLGRKAAQLRQYSGGRPAAHCQESGAVLMVAKEKRVKKLLITLMLISSAAFADIDGFYNCEITNGVAIHEGRVWTMAKEKFQFKLSSNGRSFIFGKTGFFANLVFFIDRELTPYQLSSQTRRFNDDYSILLFDGDKLRFTYTKPRIINAIKADCEKF